MRLFVRAVLQQTQVSKKLARQTDGPVQTVAGTGNDDQGKRQPPRLHDGNPPVRRTHEMNASCRNLSGIAPSE